MAQQDEGVRAALEMTLFVEAFVDELARAGVQDVCLCPGSRSTPLALAFARHGGFSLWVHVDERSAGFFALGLAKGKGIPVALLSTSGSAGANFFPAVLEARYGRVPLVVLTADRPHELRDCGAPQTVDQIHFYGPRVKWFVEMAPPQASPDLLAYSRTMAARAVATASAEPRGPVHLNFPFREPLVPLAADDPRRLEWRERLGESRGGAAGLPAHGRARGVPYVTVSQGARTLSRDALAALAAELRGLEKGLIVCGPQDDPDFVEPVTALARALRFPVLADPLSQLRCGTHDRSLVVDAYDAFLRDAEFARRHSADVVIRFGAIPTSKALLLYLQGHARSQWLVDGGDGWRDPTGRVERVIHADPKTFCAQLARLLDEGAAGSREAGTGSRGLSGGAGISSPWAQAWLRADRAARDALREGWSDDEELWEGRLFAELQALLPDGAVLFAGNSMPVRDMDAFFGQGERRVRMLANRGTNGIDGVVSTALGVSAAGSGPLVLVIGDLSFYHDLNGLLAAKRYGLSATIVLVNNDGGGIFSFLPQAELAGEHFEELFGTPIGLDFRPAVEMYGGTFVPARTWAEFREGVRRGLRSRGLTVVEVRTARDRNVLLHRQAWDRVARALSLQHAGARP